MPVVIKPTKRKWDHGLMNQPNFSQDASPKGRILLNKLNVVKKLGLKWRCCKLESMLSEIHVILNFQYDLSFWWKVVVTWDEMVVEIRDWGRKLFLFFSTKHLVYTFVIQTNDQKMWRKLEIGEKILRKIGLLQPQVKSKVPHFRSRPKATSVFLIEPIKCEK